MDSLVRASLHLRKLVRRGHGFVVAWMLAAYVASGGARTHWGSGIGGLFKEPGPLLAVALWCAFVGLRLRARIRKSGPPALLDLELGIFLTLGADALLLHFDNGLAGPWSAATYLPIAIIAAYARPVSTIFVALWTIGFEAYLHRVSGVRDLSVLANRAAFIAAFTLVNIGVLRVLVARMRTSAQKQIEQQLDRLKQDARSYRLLGAGEPSNDRRGEDRLARSSVEEIHLSVHYALDLLRRTLDLHTAVLLWMNDAGTHLRISELSTVSDDIHDAPFPSGDGVLGAVIAQKAPVSLSHLKPSYKVPYYDGPCPIRVLSAIPVFERTRADDGEAGTVAGVLAIDRRENKPFSAHEEEVAAQAARFCLRAIQNERVFVQLERAKVEQGKLYRAAQSLGAALSEKEVLDAGVKAAREIASFDLAAVTVFDEPSKKHEVCAATSIDNDVNQLVGVRFAHNTGLVSMVVQNRCALPYRGEYDAAHQVVLTRHFPWPKYPSLLVLPLMLHDRALGTLILGAKRRHAFSETVRATLEVLASHLAVSLSNARMVQKLEMMATTDGLTGLLNKRAMLDVCTQMMAAANRFERPLAVLVFDIDHFKKVNDTYGHDVGDRVIRGLGEIMKRHKRATDLVARFGGEEFVVACEQTDESGALLLADRIRDELKKTSFRSTLGNLSVTCSVGIATYPGAGRDWDTLFKRADDALYVSKRTGRDRTTVWTPKSESKAQPIVRDAKDAKRARA